MSYVSFQLAGFCHEHMLSIIKNWMVKSDNSLETEMFYGFLQAVLR